MKSVVKNKVLYRKWLIAVSTVVLLLACVFAYVLYVNSRPSNTKADTIDKSDVNTPSSDNSTKTPINNQPSRSTNSDTLAASITYIEQTESSLKIGTLIEKVTSVGDCVLTLSHDNQTVTKTVGIQPLASSSTCKGFEIPRSDLSSGSWTINITITASTDTVKLSDSYNIE